MEFKDREFIPVLLGGDINTYSVARAFYEQYQVKTYIFGKFATGPSYGSKIIEYHPNPKIDTDDYFLQTVNGFAKKHKDKKIMLIGCGDSYVALISKHKAELEKNIIAPYIDFDLMNSLQQKETFYKLCEKHGVDYPGTIIYDQSMGLDFEMNFPYPVILKPSDSISYWEHPFATQNKIYTIKDRKELEKVILDIYGAGYTDKLIIQDMIPGNDEYMRVLTSYSDRNGKVKMMCLGHVLLEEHTPKGIGNHAAIITEYDEEVMTKFKNFLESINYTGFSNFDIKYDTRDNSYKVFEINLRQGRSNYYVTGSGNNIAEYVVKDRVENKELELKIQKEPFFWRVIPRSVVYKFVKNQDLVNQCKKLASEGKEATSFGYKYDLSGNIKRSWYIFLYSINQIRKFNKYCK